MQIKISKKENTLYIEYNKQSDVMEVLTVVHGVLVKYDKRIIRCLLCANTGVSPRPRDITSYLKAPLFLLYEKLKGFENGLEVENTFITEAHFNQGIKLEVTLITNIDDIDWLDFQPTPQDVLTSLIYTQ